MKIHKRIFRGIQKAWIRARWRLRPGLLAPLKEDLGRLEANRVDCNWLEEYGFVSGWALRVQAKRVAEIGVAYGYHAEQICRSLPDLSYFGIDPYLAGYDRQDSLAADVERLLPDPSGGSMDRLYRAVACKLAVQFSGRANLLRRKSEEGAAFFPDHFFDLVYVDGDHTYEGVRRDLALWMPKVRPGGIFCGDDYDWEGVRRAVDTFVANRQLSREPSPPKKWVIRVQGQSLSSSAP